jgi:hypothetical protein
MKSVLALAAAALAAASLSAPGPAPASAAACIPGVKTIGGAPARVFCGPAKATVTLAGRTYRIAGGVCQKAPSFTVNVGALTFGGKTRLSYFGLTLPGRKDGTFTGNRVTLSFNAGAVRASLSRDAKVVVRGGLRAGTFSGRDLLGRKLAGSFAC